MVIYLLNSLWIQSKLYFFLEVKGNFQLKKEFSFDFKLSRKNIQ